MTTAAERRDRATSEAELQRLVTDMAELYGWEWVHFRPARTDKGWRTPVSGPLGKGWPDLVLVRERDRRILFVELKREGGVLSEHQADVLLSLATIAVDSCLGLAVHVWWPSLVTSGEVERLLR